MTSELLPCPFCGGEAALLSNNGAYWVQCVHNIEKGGIMSGCLNGTAIYERHSDIPDLDYDPREKAIAAWNTRVERTCRVDVRERRIMHQYWNECVCSECDQNFWMNEAFFPMPLYCPNCGRKVVEQ